jgi:CheY-specific phosphatase CheX
VGHEHSKRVEELLFTVGQQLFEAYDLRAASSSAPRESLDIKVAAIIGFAGEKLRGSVMLAMSDRALQHTKQTPGESVEDWVGELTNQLAGRLKNRLLAYGLDVAIATPLVIRGSRISPCVEGETGPLTWAFDKGDAYAWIDCDFKQGVEFVETGAAEVVSEGEALLF